MRDILITLIVFGAIPLVFKRPWTGILLFSWISYMNPHRLTYGFAYSFQFALIAAIVTIIAFALSKERKKIPLTPISIMLLIFIAWTAITTLTALAPENANARFIEFVKIQLMTILTLAMINTKHRLNWLIVMIVFSIGYYGVRGGVFSVMTGGNYRVWGPPGSFFEDNNQLALTLIMTMPLMHYLQLISTNKWVRRLLSIVILLTLGNYRDLFAWRIAGAQCDGFCLVVAIEQKAAGRVCSGDLYCRRSVVYAPEVVRQNGYDQHI